MTTRAIFAECAAIPWVDIAENLSKKYNWEPCYWTTGPESERFVKKKFPEVIFHSNIDAIRGIPPDECKNLKTSALDQKILYELSACESIVLRMMNRLDPNFLFNYEERERLYHKYVKYWAAVIDKFKPDVFVSSVSPHLMYDYVLYGLCKKRGIKTVMFMQTSLYGWSYPVRYFESGSENLRKTYKNLVNSRDRKNLKNIKLSDDTESYFKKISSDYSIAVPFYMKDQREQNKIGIYLIKRVIKNPDKIFKMIEKGKYLYSRGHYIKQKGKKIEDSEVKGMEYIFYKIDGIKKKEILKKHYKKLEKNADFTLPYVYVALAYQPENSTSPLGEFYADQLLMIDLISKCIPEDWYVYVKEHASQWYLKLHGERSRTKNFYDDIATLPNVRIIPIETSNFDLVDNSKAVATVTGTTGWEAVIRGKPTLVFGHAWYKDCEGASYILSEKDCREAISRINRGYAVNKDLVKLFLYALEKVAIKGYVDVGYEKVANISHKDNIAKLSENINKFYESI